VVATAAAIFLASLSTLFVIGTEFSPAEDRGEFNVMVDLPPGVSFDESVNAVAGVENVLLAEPEVRQVFSTVGLNGEVRKSSLRVQTTRKDERTIGLAEIKQRVRVRLADVPFLEARVADPEFVQGAPYEPPVNVFVRGDDLDELKRISGDLVAGIARIPGTVDISSTLVSGRPEMVARVTARARRIWASAWDRSRSRCATWSRAWWRASCAKTTTSTTSGCAWPPSSATTSRRLPPRLCIPLPAQPFEPETSSGCSRTWGRAASTASSASGRRASAWTCAGDRSAR
jgi:hypothetical protein